MFEQLFYTELQSPRGQSKLVCLLNKYNEMNNQLIFIKTYLEGS